jgi:hypothetical protein
MRFLILLLLPIVVFASLTDEQYKTAVNILDVASKIKASDGMTFENAMLGMFQNESMRGEEKIGDLYKYKYIVRETGVKVHPRYVKTTPAGHRYIVYKGNVYGIKMVYDRKRPNETTRVARGLFHMRLDTAKGLIRRTEELKKFRFLLRNDDRLATMLVANDVFAIKLAAYYLVQHYEVAKRRNYWNPYFKAISRYNGGWYNKTYYRSVKKAEKQIKKDIKLYERSK